MSGERVEIGNAVLLHGDCREILPGLAKHDLLLTDPTEWDAEPVVAVWKTVNKVAAQSIKLPSRAASPSPRHSTGWVILWIA